MALKQDADIYSVDLTDCDRIEVINEAIEKDIEVSVTGWASIDKVLGCDTIT